MLSVALVAATGGMAEAAKKKPKPASSDPFDNPAAADQSAKPASGSSQADDKEKPKPVLEEEAPPPASDEKGNVNFSATKSGNGKIIVKAAKDDKIKVYLEGHFFGMAPRTIQKVPPGDYIVEAVYPDGKSVTRPVSINADEEQTVVIGDVVEQPKEGYRPSMTEAQAASRYSTASILVIGGAGVAVLGGVFGIWSHVIVQKDYDNWVSHPLPPGSTADQVSAWNDHRDSLARKGNTLALTANICFVAGAAAIITGGVIGYPAWKARKYYRANPKGESEAPKDISFLVLPGPGGANASLAFRF